MIGDKLLNIRRKRRGISVFTPLSIRRGAGGEASVAVTFCDIGWLNVSVKACVLFFCVFLWEIEYWRVVWGVLSLTKDISFSHRTHRFNRTFLRTVSNPQKASGIQISQNVTAIVDINKVQHEAYILLIGVSRWSLPFPSGEGTGEGPLSSMSPVYSVLLCYSVRKRNVLREKKKCPPWKKELSSVRE